jgi:hypothetical protein
VQVPLPPDDFFHYVFYEVVGGRGRDVSPSSER